MNICCCIKKSITVQNGSLITAIPRMFLLKSSFVPAFSLFSNGVVIRKLKYLNVFIDEGFHGNFYIENISTFQKEVFLFQSHSESF